MIVLRNKFNKNIYPFAILMICISLLLMFSMRSKHILGWDIHLEYLMFQLTKEHSHWSMSNFPGNAYNTCLSITILPTIFSRFLTINDEYIFKLVTPLIFSTTSVCIYLFLKRFSNRILAFIAIFFFVSQPRFISEIPALVRQQFALLFFSLSLVVLFNKKVSIMLKRILFIIFGFSMIVSHYSTTYIALISFLFITEYLNIAENINFNFLISTGSAYSELEINAYNFLLYKISQSRHIFILLLRYSLNAYKGSIINYSFPMEFIDENKNLIYNNGGSELFK